MKRIQNILIFISIGSVINAEYYHPESNELDHGSHGVGYSYAKFSGPVSGPPHKILVKDKHGHESYDYVAKPDYHFEYGVEDPKTHVSQSRKEHRQGDDVHGEYSVAQPDGKIRTVKYSSDKHSGFQAEVLIDGKPLHYEALQEQQAHLQAQQEHLAHHHQEHHHQPEEIIHHHGGDEEESYSGGYTGYSEDGGESIDSGEEGYSGYYRKK